MAAPSPNRSGSIRAQLERISASPVFAHAGRMSRLLAYLVEAELAGDGARLNQSRIAIDVFGRNETFDPSVDSIVRVEIGRLRNKLREYYATDGREDAIVFELPKGRYRPSIKFGDAPPARPRSDERGAETAVQRDRRRGRRLRYLAVAVALSAVALISADGWLGAFDARSGVTDDTATVSPREAPGLESWSAVSPTSSPEAYALYLRVWDGPPNDAQALLDEALALDPGFALAHAAKAMFYSQSLTNTAFGPMANASDLPRVELLARAHAKRALELDSEVGIAHVALGNLDFYTWRWTEARRAFEHAAATAPNEVALLQYALLDSSSGRVEEGIARIEHLIEANPPSQLLHAMLGVNQAFAKKYDAAAATLRGGLAGAQVNSSQLIFRGWLAMVEIARGNPQAAVQELELIDQLGATSDMLPFMAHAYARVGRAADAKRLFDRFEHAAAGGGDYGAGAWVEAYLAIGEDEKALQWLELAAQKAARHEPDGYFFGLMHMRLNVLADPVLDRPEFVAALGRIRGD